MPSKYYTLWAKPCTVGRKSLNVNFREEYTRNVPSTPLVFGSTRRLTAVKEVLYNPCLPTLRRMDMDEVLRKLTQDHSRHSTPCRKEDFKNSTITLFRPADRPLSGTRITETGRQLQATSYQPIESGGMSEFLQRSMTAKSRERQLSSLAPNEPLEPYTFMPEPYLKYSADQMKFNGYATRYLSPRETGSWRYSLRQEPFIDLRGQRPIPATIYSRYRDAHPRASVAAMHWR
ncbi:sperm microtubule inner protein 8-like isoform X2 [Montipora foliosa]|uniref:sperm microtubule inner protein 8-like isoform X2 n=1 Tax=Montipora foliosa TaxID=591990 RepID=UPI0035F1339D